MGIRHFVLLLAASMGVAAPAAASSLVNVQVTWRLSFGGNDGVHPGYGLHLVQRDGDLAGTQLVTLDVSDRTALARLAGLPLLRQDYRLAQNDEYVSEQPGEPSGAAEPSSRSHQWVWWTLGGLATTAALLTGGGSSGGGEDLTICGTNCVSGPTGPSGNVGPVIFDDGGAHADCSGADCAVCPNGDVLSDCEGGDDWLLPVPGLRGVLAQRPDPIRQSWLDAGTGQMGDLLAR